MFFKRKKRDNLEKTDVLEAYPERIQISAIPERRYLRTSRILAIVTFLNMGVMIALAGVFVYLASRLDISVANSKVVNLYAMDPEHKVIQASEHDHLSVPALQLMMEAALRDYVVNRHGVVWDQEAQEARWGIGGPVALYSSQNVYKQFSLESMNALNESRSKKLVKDVHLYDLKQTPSGMWEGLFDVFDMPIPDMFNPVCHCSENTRECLACKEKNALNRRRYKVFIRSGFNGTESLRNPLGIMIRQYNLLYQPIDSEEKMWNLPPILRPQL